MPNGSPSYTIDSAELKRRRENAGWSLRELAAECAAAGRTIGAPQISMYETGRANPRPKNLRVLADVFRCEPDDLVVRKVAA